MGKWLAGIAAVLGTAVWAAGQTTEAHTEARDVPTACLDRSTIRVMEPVCLAVVSRSLPENPVQSVQVLGPGEAPKDLGNLNGQWGRSQLEILGRVVEQRVSVGLAADKRPGGVGYLFNKPGDYVIRVGIGSQTTDVPLKVEAGEAEDGRAYLALGADSMEAMLNEGQTEDPSPRVQAACADVVSHFPHTSCADYARAYLAVAAFKGVYKVNDKRGGRAVYGDVTVRLAQSLPGVRDGFYGEQVGFFTAYAFGLEFDFPQLLHTVDSVPSRLTPWGDKMEQMKQEVLAHTLGQAPH